MIEKLEQRIKVLHQLGERLLNSEPTAITSAITLASAKNQWFTPENCRLALHRIAAQLLQETALLDWATQYNIEETKPKTISLVPAGNLPLVGFHDLVCTFIAGHKAQIKPSERDEVLLPAVLELLFEISPAATAYFEIVERLHQFDAVIATGSNNTSRYFEAYFGKYPHIIRGNRNAVAVLDGKETKEELDGLSRDIFEYFGLGCRSVSQVYLPEGYDLDALCAHLAQNTFVSECTKWQNNYDYNQALLLLNLEPHRPLGNLVLRESAEIVSRIATLHYAFYTEAKQLQLDLLEKREQLQCIATQMPFSSPLPLVQLGQSQHPSLADYPDGVDVMAFLTELD